MDLGSYYRRFRSKFQRYAIHDLALYVSIIFAVGLFIQVTNPMFYFEKLSFVPSLVLRGEIWRIITVIFYPPNMGDFLWTILAILVWFSMSRSLQAWWGDFDFNVYFFGCLFINEIVLIILSLVMGPDSFIAVLPFLPIYMYFSVFMAYAITFPEAQFLIMFVLPVKAKHLAIVEVAIYLYQFLRGAWIVKLYILLAFAGVIIYFLIQDRNNRIISNWRWKFKQWQRRRNFR